MTTPTATQYYHQDGLGSVVAMTDETGAATIRQARRYDPTIGRFARRCLGSGLTPAAAMVGSALMR